MSAPNTAQKYKSHHWEVVLAYCAMSLLVFVLAGVLAINGCWWGVALVILAGIGAVGDATR